MYIKDGIVYANTLVEDIKIIEFKIIDELYLLLMFSTGEKRVLDFKQFLKYPVYSSLSDSKKFEEVAIENGILVWDNGEIDISPETLYANSHEYNDVIV